MAFYFGLPKKYMNKVICRVVCALARLAHTTPRENGGLARPDARALEAMVTELGSIAQYGLERHVLCIDGLVFRMPAPPKQLQAQLKSMYWNGHYKCWGLTVLTMVNLRGQCVYVTEPTAASEKQLVKSEHIDVWLRDVRDEIGRDVGILTDSLYSFNRKGEDESKMIAHAFSVGPKTLKRLKILAFGAHDSDELRAQAKQALFSTRYVGQLRAVNENFNRQLRSWKTIGRSTAFRSKFFRLRGHSKYMPPPRSIVASVCFLVNRRMAARNALRPVNWRPKPLMLVDDGPPAGFKYGYGLFGGKEPIMNGHHLAARLLKLRLPTKKKKKAIEKKNLTRTPTTTPTPTPMMMTMIGTMF